MKSKITKAVILNKGTISWFSKGSIHGMEPPSLLNKPFIDYQIRALQKNGISDIHMLLAGDAAHDLCQYDGLQIHRQDDFMGTAGALLTLKDVLKDEPFILLNVSTYIDEEKVKAIIDEYAELSDSCGGVFAVYESLSDFDYSETINISKTGSILGIYRAHRSQNRRSNKGLAGFYLLSPKCFNYIPDNTFFDLKEQLLPFLIKNGLKIKAFIVNGECSVLTSASYLKLKFRLLREALEGDYDKFGLKDKHTTTIHGDVKIVGEVAFGDACDIRQGVTLIGPVLFGDRCIVNEGATIVGPVVIGHNCRIGANAWLQSSVLHDGVVLSEYTQVRNSLLGEGHQVAAADSRNCVDALIDAVEMRRDDCFVNHEMPQLMEHYDTLSCAYSVAKYQIKKRAFDVMLATSVILFTLPVWVLVAIAIRLESKGPIFYVQKRCGIHGKEFPMIKFRTMQPNAHQLQDELREKLNEADGPVFKMSNDPRLTKVGRFLRKTSIDELPQLINVLLGHMSCVGPRPLAIKEMVYNPHWRDLRLMVKPGLTGLWQVSSRDDPRFHAWIEKDIDYVRNQSLRRDIRILFGTIKSALQGV